jgi:hypothetical protein
MAHIKRRTVVGIGREASAFQTKSDQIVGMGLQNLTIDLQKNVITNEQAYGRIEDVRDSRIASQMVQITIEGITQVDTIGQLVYAAMGTLSTAANTPETDVNTHTFTVANTNQHPSYSIAFEDPVQDQVCVGCRLESLTTTIVAGEWVTYSATFMGSMPIDATESLSFTDKQQFSAEQATVRLAAVDGSFAGAGIDLSTLTLNVTKNTEVHYAFGSVAPKNVINKQFNVTGDFSILNENETYYDLFLAHTPKALEVALSGANIGATGTPGSLKIKLEQVVFNTWNNNAGNDEKVMENIEFRAEYNESESDANGGMMSAVLINASANSTY